MEKKLEVKASGRDVTKMVAATVVGSGVHTIVKGIIENNVDRPKGIYGRISLKVASYLVSGMAATAVKKQSDELVDTVFEAWDLVSPKPEETEDASEAVVQGELVFEDTKEAQN